MTISFNNHEVKFNLKNKKRIKNWIKRVIEEHKKSNVNISYIFTSENYILEINKKYLNHNYYTDIITFDYSSNELIEGDIFISIDTVYSNSKKFKTNFNEEMLRVIIHGIFHLIGFKDKSKQQKLEMRELENKAILYFNSLNE